MKPKFRILVADDNPEIHKDFKKILLPYRENLDDEQEQILFGAQISAPEKNTLPLFDIDSAFQGTEAVQLVEQSKKQQHPYALAFIDVRMPPGIDGIATIQKLWNIDPEIQIVICTAYSDYTWQETVNQLGENDNFLILKKPFENDAVRQLAYALSKKWQLTNINRQHTEELEGKIKARTNSLLETLSLARATLESTTDGILVLNLQQKVVDYNNQFIKMWSLPVELFNEKEGSINLNFIAHLLPQTDLFLYKMDEIFEAPQNLHIDTLHLNNGKIYERYSFPHKLGQKIIGCVLSFRDMTDRVKLEKKLSHQATHDSLTGMPNRLYFSHCVAEAIKNAKRQQQYFALLYIDIDRFKIINDSIHHSFGDKVLIAIAKRLRQHLREKDILARIGGDEFVILLTNLTKYEFVIDLAKKLLDTLAQPFSIDSQEINLTASAGISLYPRDGSDPDKLLKNADIAMYRAKRNGGNTFQFYTYHINEESMQRITLENELHKAIREHQFFLYYQPQFDLITGKLKGTEALLRWHHPKNGVLLPEHFLSVAEESKLLIPIGEWVLRTACKQNKLWHEMGFIKNSIAVNISAQQLLQDNIVTLITNILKETGLEPKYLELELTENIIISNKSILKALNQFKKLGIRIVLDDFGTGYSSLTKLQKFPVDCLKIDKSFIQNIGQSKKDEEIIRAIISIAKKLNINVVAEGVESIEQISYLKKYACDLVQGYYFSKPVSPLSYEKTYKNYKNKKNK